MEFGHTTTRTRLAPQGSVNLNDLRLSVSQSRANFTRVRARAGRLTSNTGPKADFLTFVSLTCEIYQAQGDDLVPIQQYPSVLETYQGKGHTSLVTHAQLALAAPSNFSRGTIGSYSEGIVIKRPRHSILEERADGLNSFITELRIRSHAPLKSHPNITRLRGVGWDFEDEDATIPRPILLEEFAPQGALDNFWKNWKFVKMSFKAKLDFCRDIAEGLSVLHDCGVVHGDVKPENILVFPRHDARDSFMLKLTDFGHSVIESDTAETLPAFTPQWSAPEVTKMTSMTFQQMKATDYYSFGLVTLSIMLGRPFYTEVEEIESHKQNGSILLELVGIVEKEDRCNDDSDLEVGTIARLLSKTVQLNPDARSLRGSMDIIDLYLVENQVTSSRVPVVHCPTVRVPALDVISKVSVGYHTLINCSHHLKARIVTTLLELATKPNDPRNSAAQWELAICHFSGFGIPRDFEAASHWLTMARENGVAAAQEFFKPLQDAIVVAKGIRDRDTSASWQRNKTTSLQSERLAVTNTTAATLESIASDVSVPNDRASRSVSIDHGLESKVPGTAEWSRPTDDRTIDPKHKSMASLQRYLQDSEIDEDLTQSVPTSMTSALQEAIKTNSVDQLKVIIANDPNSISSVDESGNTPLLLAAHHGQLEVFRYLLGRENPRASAYNKSGQTALHLLTMFDDKHVNEFVVLLIKSGADILHEALPVSKDEETLVFSLGLRCCPMLNSILHNRTALLESLLEAAHGDPSGSVCQICEAGSRFRRILAVCLSLFRIDALEILRNHLKTHGEFQTIDLANVQVWTGQNLLRLSQVPFKSVAVSTMDLPEDFFRAMIYGGSYSDVLERTIVFVTTVEDPRFVSRSSLEMDTLAAAVSGDSLDAVNFMLHRTTATQQDLPLWLLSPIESSQFGTRTGSPNLLRESITSGLRHIFDRLLCDHVPLLRDEFQFPCQKEEPCRDYPRWWLKNYRLLQGREMYPARPRGHTHSCSIVEELLSCAIHARHQDSYFLSKIVDKVENQKLFNAPRCLLTAVQTLKLNAASILLSKNPDLLMSKLMTPYDRVLMGFLSLTNWEGSERLELDRRYEPVLNVILRTGSYEQCRFVLKHLCSRRSAGLGYPVSPGWRWLQPKRQFRRQKDKSVFDTAEESVPEWQKCPLHAGEYESLLVGNILRNSVERKALWDVIEVQVASGHSVSGVYLRLAIKCSNTEALLELLNRGWRVNGEWKDCLHTPLQGALEHSKWWFDDRGSVLRYAELDTTEQEALMKLHNVDGQPKLHDPNLQTHREIYGEYSKIRQSLLCALYEHKLDEAAIILRARGGRVSPFSSITTTGPTASRIARAWGAVLHALLYAVILPVAVVFGTQNVWHHMSTGQKWRFVYLWALLSYAFPHFWLVSKGAREFSGSRGQAIWYFACFTCFLFHHIGLPVLVVRFHWSPLQSCQYRVEAGELGSSCTNYTFLLPLVFIGVELVLVILLFIGNKD